MKRKHARSGRLSRAVLLTLASAGVLTAAILAPNALQALKILEPDKYKRRYMREVIKRLEEQGFIKLVPSRGYQLTEAGERQATSYELDTFVIKKPHRWDGIWRVLIFDVKEVKRHQRDLFRRQLVQLGFMMLQRSVWAFPYECADVVALIKRHHGVAGDVLYMQVQELEGETRLKEHFALD